LTPFHGALQDRVAEVPDATLDEHREWVAETHDVVVGLSTIWKALKHLELTLKKSLGRSNKAVPTLPRPAGTGSRASPSWT
jgi:transposase